MDMLLLIAHSRLYCVTFGVLLDFSIILIQIKTAGGTLVNAYRLKAVIIVLTRPFFEF